MACLTDSLWLDKLVGFFSPLPLQLTELLLEGQFLETTLQGCSVAFCKACVRLSPCPAQRAGHLRPQLLRVEHCYPMFSGF